MHHSRRRKPRVEAEEACDHYYLGFLLFQGFETCLQSSIFIQASFIFFRSYFYFLPYCANRRVREDDSSWHRFLLPFHLVSIRDV